MEFLWDFFGSVWSSITGWVYVFAVWVFSKIISGLIYFGIWLIGFAWDVAQRLLVDLNISSYIQQTYSWLDEDLRSILFVCKFPECLNTIVSAYTTRIVLGYIPFSGYG